MARTAIRMGAESVTIIFNRSKDKLPALETEVSKALDEGIHFLFDTHTREFIGEDNTVKALAVTDLEGDKIIPINRVMIAVGSKPANRIVSTSSGIEVNEAGYVITRERPYGMTTRKGVFAGGDVVHTPKTVVLAMKEAKQVAKGIIQYIDAVKLLSE